MKYWRGYLVTAVLGFFSWALLDFAKNHTQLVDMFYPYMTRMIQGTLAQWSGGTDQLLWQLLLVLFVVVLLATVVMMIVLRWNPIQWLGWVLAVASLVLFLNTGLYPVAGLGPGRSKPGAVSEYRPVSSGWAGSWP